MRAACSRARPSRRPRRHAGTTRAPDHDDDGHDHAADRAANQPISQTTPRSSRAARRQAAAAVEASVTPGAITSRSASFLSSIPDAAAGRPRGAARGRRRGRRPRASATLSAHAARISRAGGARRWPRRSRASRPTRGWRSRSPPRSRAICFGATGRHREHRPEQRRASAPNITVQMALTLGGGLLLAAACALERRGRVRAWGLGAAIALFALAAFTALSVVWSVDPANSWLEASRTFAYAATFAGAIALVRLAAGRWRSVLAGVLLATVAVSRLRARGEDHPGVARRRRHLRAPAACRSATGTRSG